MTTPAPGVGTQVPFEVPAGGGQVRITDGGNSPVGAVLVNRGDNGGTVWVQAGPAGSAAVLPLGPGGTMRWTDPQELPYARQAATSTKPETIILTNQAADYANPTAVAAATAAQLAAQGIPSTFLDGTVFDGQISAGSSTAPLNVSGYASLVVAVNWPQPTPTSPASLNLLWSDAALPSFPTVVQWVGNDNRIEAGNEAWSMPVLAPTLRLRNIAGSSSSPCYATVIGTNRTVPSFHHLGDEAGARGLAAQPFTAGQLYRLAAWNQDQGLRSGTVQTRMNGRCQVQVYSTPGAGSIRANYIDQYGGSITVGFRVPGGDSIVDYNHPRGCPVWWDFVADQNGPPSALIRIVVVAQDY